MINQVLDYTKKYYPWSLDTSGYAIEVDGVTGSFSATYIVGQYINIQNSVINDGTYKITTVSGSKLTLDATLTVEPNNTDICIWGLRLPAGLISLISDITTYVSGQTTKADLASESQGNRSISYKNGSSWQSAFKSQLSQYRNLYDDRITWCRKYNIRTKGW